MLLGSALHDLQQEAMRRSQGSRYSDMWEWQATKTPHLARTCLWA